MSQLNVNTIGARTGTTVSIASGHTLSGITQGVTEYDVWQLTANLTASASPITTFVRPTGTLQTKLGTGMSVSSGIWTFPSTGIWEVQAQCLYSNDNDNQLGEVRIYSSDDNFSTEDEIGYNGYRDKSIAVGSGSIRVLLDIQDTSNDKIKFTYTDSNGTANLLGESTRNRTTFNFIRFGDT